MCQLQQSCSWQPYWLELLKHLKDVIPTDWLVIVTGDRGVYAKWLYEQIQDNGWHPFLRINQPGQFQPLESAEFQPLDSVVTTIGQSWSGQVSCFKTNPQGLYVISSLGRWLQRALVNCHRSSI